MIKNIFREEITFPDERMLLQLTESLAEPHCSSAKSVSKNAFLMKASSASSTSWVLSLEGGWKYWKDYGKQEYCYHTSGYCANHYSCILAPVSTACLRIFGDSFSRTIIHGRVRWYVHVLLSENPICHLLKDNGFFWSLPVSR